MTVSPNGETTVDLSDPERRWVIVSLQPDLDDGSYTVRWLTRSFVDGDRTEGSFTFTVDAASATPKFSDTTGGTPALGTPPRPVFPAHVEPDVPSLDVPPMALLVSLGVGLGVAVGIWLVWRLVRPSSAEA